MRFAKANSICSCALTLIRVNQGIGMQFVAMLLHQLIYRFKNEIGLTGTAANAGKAERRRRIEIFLHMLEEQKECTGFEPGMFVALVDKVVIQQDGHMEFCFRNGMKCVYPQ